MSSTTLDNKSEWDEDVSINRGIRDFINEDKSKYQFDVQYYHEHPFPMLVLTTKDGGGVYAGNPMHGVISYIEDGSVVHFRTVINLHSNIEHMDVKGITQLANTVPALRPGMAGVMASSIDIPLPSIMGNNEFNGEEGYITEEVGKDLIDLALYHIKTCEKPVLVRCSNGMSRTVACLTTYIMLDQFVTFKDAYLQVNAKMNPAYINLAYERVLVTEIHRAMQHRSVTTCPMSSLLPIIEQAKKDRIAPFNVPQIGTIENVRAYALKRARSYREAIRMSK